MELVFIVMSLFTLTSSLSGLNLMTSNEACNYCLSTSCKPTIVPPEDFSPRIDRLKLHTAMSTITANEDDLISVLTERTDMQRLMIAEDYIRTGTTLTDDVGFGTTGRSTALLQALATPLPFFYAGELNRAVTAKDANTLIEMLTSLPGCAIREISVVFRMMFGQSLYSKISSTLWLKFRSLLLSLAKGDREELEEINADVVKADSEALFLAGVDAWLVDHSKFIEIFTQRSFHQLRETIVAYNNLRKAKDSNYSILNDINNLFSGDVKATYTAIISNLVNQPAYFAKELESALSGIILIDSQKVTRIIRGRCELDLEDIKTQYAEIYGKPLVTRVRQQTRGIYQKTLLAILKE